MMIAILAALGILLPIGWPYYLGLAAAAGMIPYQYTLIRERSREDCFRAFRHSNLIGAAVFAGIALAYLLPGLL